MVRIKHRYLLCELLFECSIDPASNVKVPELGEGMLAKIIRESVAANFGDVGISSVGSSLNGAYPFCAFLEYPLISMQ